MPKFVVEGGRPLRGRIRPSGNKNAALPILAATLLTDEPVELDNVPDIRDVRTLIDLLGQLGVAIDWVGPNRVRVHAADVNASALTPHLAARIRASILLAGPMLARKGRMTLPPPGGDVIGRRRVDTHFLALSRLGARVETSQGYHLETDGLRGADIFLDEPSVTATENTIMAAVLARGSTRIRNAAAEPHVQDLCHMLNGLGARISGIGTHILEIEGVDRLHGGEYRIGSDHIEVGSFIGLAAVTAGELTIEDAAVEHLDSTLVAFERLGIRCEIRGADLFVPEDQDREIRMDLGGHIPKIDDGPWPAFPADLTSIALVVATQCRGTILIHEKMFESRMFFADKVIGMGARIVLCDPHRAVVVGPSRLHAGVVESPDIRAGMALLIAALAAEGESHIFNVRQIERGYERIDDRLRALGAQIQRFDSREHEV
ncbi:MAG TPA: UDP-N-acetylglucosamine 1-carboxyvinyltransferase [Longimicrobiales bacterium]|nr:UDP-N-acetylglucosamine 1-carboxyvinyltransferase [Longimicrobiales bacterium]